MADGERQEDLRGAGRDQPRGEERPELANVGSVGNRRRCRNGGGGDDADGGGDERADLGIGTVTDAPPHRDSERAEGHAGQRREKDGGHRLGSGRGRFTDSRGDNHFRDSFLESNLDREYIAPMRRRDHAQHMLEQWRREAPELDRSPFGVVGRISRLAQLLQGELEPIFAAHGVNGGEFDVLAALRRAGRPYRLTPTELSTALIVTSGGMTKRLNGLERGGLIRREPDPNDRRSTAVSLTREGKRLVEKILPEHVANEQRLLEELSAKERAELAGLLETLAIALGDDPNAGTRGAAARRRRRR